MAKITVIGSINMDLVVKSDEIPKPGETLFGNELLQIPGGKGANQAVAMSRLGAQVSFLGKIAKSLGKVTILNPAPAMELDDFIIQNTDILIPNEHELERLSGIKITDKASIRRGRKGFWTRGSKKSSSPGEVKGSSIWTKKGTDILRPKRSRSLIPQRPGIAL